MLSDSSFCHHIESLVAEITQFLFRLGFTDSVRNAAGGAIGGVVGGATAEGISNELTDRFCEPDEECGENPS